MRIKGLLTAAFMAAVSLTAFASCSSSDKKADGATAGETASTVHAVTVLEKGAQIAPEDSKLIVIDFNATWCGPCRRFAPTFDKVAGEYTSKAVFYSVDVDIHPELAALFKVQSIPMVAYIKPDGTYTRTVGLIDETQFKAAIEAALK
ncbi:MAG: thioredoxin fold domain-containing protein [Bacteroidales bacterium]|nr:thioredoxin fold domain-containing protein [Bacteroidales bacterium]